MEAIVLVGGLGKRLRSEVSDLPKAMAPINGRPFLEYQMGYLKNQGITRVIMAVGYKKEHIQQHFQNEYQHIEIVYAEEHEPLGTGGAIVNALPLVKNNRFFILNGDTVFNISLDKLIEKHRDLNADLTMALRKIEDTTRYGSVEIDHSGRIKGFLEKGEAQGKGLINGGIYFANRSLIENCSENERFSFEKEVLEQNYKTQKFYGVPFDDYFLDIGIPEDYKRAQHEFRELGY